MSLPIPNPLDTWVALILWMMLLIIAFLGVLLFRRYSGDPTVVRKQARAISYLGVAALIMGVVGLFLHYQQAFYEIEQAADISPAIVASAMKAAFNYPIFGGLILVLALVIRFAFAWRKAAH